jgi:hypothetical protein
MPTKAGHTKYIETPEKLWDLFCDYVKHEHNSPMYKREYVGKDGNVVDTPLPVPITFEGFECWLQDNGVISNLSNYETNKDGSYDDYQPTLTRIKKNCFVQNFKGASVGLFNAGLIGKKLGLVEKSEQKITQEQPLFPE